MTRRRLRELSRAYQMGATSIIISEFLADGAVKLEYSGGDSPRAITVAKMRKTKIDNCSRSFDLTEQGIKIYGKEKVYSKKD